MPILLLLMFIVPGGCDSEYRTYKISGDPLQRKLFETELRNQNISFDVDKNGFYTTSPYKFEKMVTIGRVVEASSRRRNSLPIDGGCSSKMLLAWLGNREIIFAVERSSSGTTVALRADDYEKGKVLNHYAGFHGDCFRAGLEPRYTEIWKETP